MSLPKSALLPLLASVLLFVPKFSNAAECGELSPTTLNGTSLHEAHVPAVLTSDQLRAAKSLLRRFRGNWKGTGTGILCLGQGPNIREKVTHYEIEGDGEGNRSRGSVQLELEHERGKIIEELSLQLNGPRLGTSHQRSSFVEVLSITESQVEWLIRSKANGANGARPPLETRWLVRFTSTQGRQGQQAIVEHSVYTLGGLGSKGSWSLYSR